MFVSRAFLVSHRICAVLCLRTSVPKEDEGLAWENVKTYSYFLIVNMMILKGNDTKNVYRAQGLVPAVKNTERETSTTDHL